MRKNYKQHIRNVHPKKDPDDLTPFGQSKLTSFFTQAGPAKVVTGKVGEGADNRDVDSGENSLDLVKEGGEDTLDVGDDLSSKKRRHKSSESTDSGIVDTAETSSESKKVKKDNAQIENQVTNNQLNEKLDAIMKGVQELNDAKVFKPPAPAKPDIPDLQTAPHLSWIKHCRSLEEILAAGFSYDEGIVTCSVCGDQKSSGSFYYPASSGVEFSEDEYLPKEFSSLKRNILRHIASSKSNTEAVMEIKAKEKADGELKSKNHLAGINLGMICMMN